MQRNHFWAFWLMGSLLAAAGCGGTPKYSVEGDVTYPDGSPFLGGGQVLFEPKDPNLKVSARGTINEDGTFRMGTEAEADGVLEGAYRVAVVPPPVRNLNRPPPGWPPLKKKYTTHAASGLECTVTRGKNVCKLVVEK